LGLGVAPSLCKKKALKKGQNKSIRGRKVKRNLLIVFGMLTFVGQTRLDEFIQSTTFKGQRFIQSYRIESGSAYLQLNPSLWNSLSPMEQRLICDGLVSVDVWKKMGLINAWLYVYNTEIGRVASNWTGGWKFKPFLKYLK
jgi:hypothetical protein